MPCRGCLPRFLLGPTTGSWRRGSLDEVRRPNLDPGPEARGSKIGPAAVPQEPVRRGATLGAQRRAGKQVITRELPSGGDRDQMRLALAALLRAVRPGGSLALMLKEGVGESWSEAKLGPPGSPTGAPTPSGTS